MRSLFFKKTRQAAMPVIEPAAPAAAPLPVATPCKRHLKATPVEPCLVSADVGRIHGSCPGSTFMPLLGIDSPLFTVERWLEEAQLIGITDTYLGKRQNARSTWSEVMLIRIKSGPLQGKVIRARSKDISLGGIGIILRSNLDAGTEVELSVENQPAVVKATVAHCTKMINGSLAGFEFDL